MNQAPSMLKPALISGVAFGIAGSIPYLGAINCFCCALIVGGGLMASFLYSKDCRKAGVTFGAGNGATIGVLAGLTAGATTGILDLIVSRTVGLGDWQDAIDQLQAAGAEIPPETLDQITGFMESSGPMVISLLWIFLLLVAGVFFGTISGLIGGSIFKVEEVRPGMYTQTPPPPPVG